LSRGVIDPPHAFHRRPQACRIEDVADHAVDRQILNAQEGGGRAVQRADTKTAPNKLAA
jgi:hypothetical protein